MLNPGLAPWAMQEYRPYRALLRPHQLLVDALVLAVSLINYLLVLMRLLSRPPNEMLACSDAHCLCILSNQMLTYLRMGCWVLWCGVVLFSIFVTK